jgi:corrinoid protein of di/trimethylamine methyltransferase
VIKVSERETIFARLSQAVIVGDTEESAKAAQDAINAGIEPFKAITDGLAKGMEVVGEKFESKEYFLPEVLISADAMYAGLNLLLPLLKKDKTAEQEKVVLGVVEGDIHDIGKNIVKAMLTAGGYEVIDLGRDVPTQEFVEKASGEKAKVIAMSTMMTPTLMSMKGVEEELEKKGLKGEVRTIIGGGTVTEDWRSKIGSDAYGKDAVEAVDKVKLLIDQIKAALELAKKKREKGS